MHFRRKFVQHIAILCILAIESAFVVPASAVAKASKNSNSVGWGNVLTLRKGAAVRVVLFSKKTLKGKVEGVEPTGIALTTKEGSLFIPKTDIKSIITLAKPKVANPGSWAMVGGITFAAAGSLATSVHQTSQLNSGRFPTGNADKFIIPGLAVAVGGLAAFVLVGKPRVIYKAVQPPADAGK